MWCLVCNTFYFILSVCVWQMRSTRHKKMMLSLSLLTETRKINDEVAVWLQNALYVDWLLLLYCHNFDQSGWYLIVWLFLVRVNATVARVSMCYHMNELCLNATASMTLFHNYKHVAFFVCVCLYGKWRSCCLSVLVSWMKNGEPYDETRRLKLLSKAMWMPLLSAGIWSLALVDRIRLHEPLCFLIYLLLVAALNSSTILFL